MPKPKTYVLSLAILLVSLTPGDRRSRLRDSVLYNSAITESFTDSGAPLVCDGKEEPTPVSVTIPADYSGPLNPQWPFRATSASLSYQENQLQKGTFDIALTVTVSANSLDLAKTYVDGHEAHGCDHEFFAISESHFDDPNPPDPSKFTMVGVAFVAGRNCVGGRAITSSEGHATTSFPIQVKSDQDYEACSRTRTAVLADIVQWAPGTSNAASSSNLFGVSVASSNRTSGSSDMLPSIQLSRPTQPDADLNVMYVPPRFRKFANTADGGLAFCPLSISAKKIDLNNIGISVSEGVKRLPPAFACGVFQRSHLSIAKVAEHAHPTTSVIVAANDSWWTIARRLWGNGRLYSVLQHSNPHKHLFKGTVLVVPSIEQVLADPSVVRAGDSLWTIALRLDGNANNFHHRVESLAQTGRSPDLIYPYTQIQQ